MHENIEKMNRKELLKYRKLIKSKKLLALATIRADNLRLEALEEEMIALVKCKKQEELRRESEIAEKLDNEKKQMTEWLEIYDETIERIDKEIMERGK